MNRLFAVLAVFFITVAALFIQGAIPEPGGEAALQSAQAMGTDAPGGTFQRVGTYYVPACQAQGGMCYSAGSGGCASCCISVGYTSGFCFSRNWGDPCYCTR